MLTCFELIPGTWPYWVLITTKTARHENGYQFANIIQKAPYVVLWVVQLQICDQELDLQQPKSGFTSWMKHENTSLPNYRCKSSCYMRADEIFGCHAVSQQPRWANDALFGIAFISSCIFEITKECVSAHLVQENKPLGLAWLKSGFK